MLKNKISVLGSALVALSSLFTLSAHADTATTTNLTLDNVTVYGSIDKLGASYSKTAPFTVLKGEDLTRLNPKLVSQAMTYESGVYANYTDSKYPLYKVHGLSTKTLLNGSDLSANYFRPDASAVERVEILKGANSILQGSAEAGGTVNLVLKQAHKGTDRNVNLSVGNNKYYSVGVDVNQDLNDQVAGRVVSSWKSYHGSKATTNMKEFYVSPSLLVNLDEKAKLTLLASYKHENGRAWEFIMPGLGTAVLVDGVQQLPRNAYYGSDKAYFKLTEWTAGANFTYQFDKDTKWTTDVQYANLKNEYATADAGMGMVMHTQMPGMPAPVTSYYVMRAMEAKDVKSHRFGADTRLEHTHHLGNNWEDTTAFGFSYTHTNDETRDGVASADFNKASRASLTNRNFTEQLVGSWASPEKERLHTSSVYFLNSVNWNKQFFFNSGVRWTKYSGTEENSLGSNKVSKEYATYALGLSYKSKDTGLTPYINYSESVKVLPSFITQVTSTGYGYGRPTTTTTTSKNEQSWLTPNKARQISGGVRYEPSFLDGYVDVSLFNVHSEDAYGRTGSDRIPFQKSRGFEVAASVNPVDFWNVKLGYTRQVVVEQKTEGGAFTVAPFTPSSLFSVYNTLTLKQLNDVQVGVGFRRIGGTTLQNLGYMDMTMGAGRPAMKYVTLPAQRTKGVWLFDANINVPFNKNVSVNVSGTNLSNKLFVTGCNSICYYNEGRQVRADLNVKF